MAMTAFMVVGCTGGSSDRSDGAVVDDLEPEAIELGEDEADLIAGREAVDGVVRMNPPTRLTVPAGFGPMGDIVSSRAILSITTPNGPVDLFETVVADSDMGPGLQRCTITAQSDGGGAGCGPLEERQDQTVGSSGAIGDDDSTIYEFAGPADMTHFILRDGDARLVLLTRDGYALFYVPRAFCVGGPEIESAWRGDTELDIDNPVSC